MKSVYSLAATCGLLTLAASSLIAANVPGDLTPTDWSEIHAAHDLASRAISTQDDGTYGARSSSQAWNTHFDGEGFSISPDSAAWRWGLTLRSYAVVDGPIVSLSSPAAVLAEADRLETRWDDTLQEWFVNSPAGLAQGWIFSRNPAGDAPAQLRLELAISGGLQPSIAADARSITFAAKSGAAALTYSGLHAWDADGKEVPVQFAALPDDPASFAVEIDARHARFPVTIDPVAQQAYLKASNTDAGDLFGAAVAISGNTLVVGATGEDSGAVGVNGFQAGSAAMDSGAAYVFVRSGSTWVQQAYLKASNTTANDSFGSSVAISGETIVVGAGGQAGSAGAAYVFVRNGTTWTEQAYLKASNPTFSDQFGDSAAISGDTIVVGAVGEDSSSTIINANQADNGASGAGAAYVFVRIGTNWTQEAYLKATNTGGDDQFGVSTAISGDTIVVGAWAEDSFATVINGIQTDNTFLSAGAAYVFVRNGGAWSQQAYLKASNTNAGDFFGTSVAISGETIVVGASYEDSNATGSNGNQVNNGAMDAGAAYVFVRNVATWTQQAYLKASNTGLFDEFGHSVAISGDKLVITAPREGSNANGVDGDQTDDSAFAAGAAYVFARTGTTWTQSAYLKASNTGGTDEFGHSAAISGDTVVVGAWKEDSNATGINNLLAQTDNTFMDSGAAYAFLISQPAPQPAPKLFLKGKTKLTTSRPRIVLRGTATDATRVEYKAGKGGFKKAKGPAARWKIPLRLTSTRTTVAILATGPGGRSKVLKVKIRRQ